MTAVAGLIVARANVLAQVQGKVYRIGYPNLRAGPAALEEAFLQGMRDLGYVVGRNLLIEYRWANSDIRRFDAMVDELVRKAVAALRKLSTRATTTKVRRSSQEMRSSSPRPMG